MSDSSPHSAAGVSELDARFARLPEEYQRLRDTATAAVVRWEWYGAAAHDLRPLWYERDLDRPGRRLARRPARDRDACRIGFDAHDRPVVWLDHSGFLDGTLSQETYRNHSAAPAIVHEARFRVGGEPIYLHEYRFEAGRIRSASTVAVGGGGHEEYEYTADRVTRVRAYHAERSGGPGGRLGPVAPYQVIDAAYDDAGLTRLEIAWPGPGGRTELRYARPPAGHTLATGIETVRRALLRQVPAAILGMAIDEPAYCVALGYLAEDPIGVSVHVGLDSDRREWLADQSDPDGAERDTFVLWNPCDLRGPADVDYADAADAARLLRQELTLADPDGEPGSDADAGPETSGVNEYGRRLLCAVAAELNRYDWTGVLPVTDDFVVYAADWELVDLDRNLPECVPAERLALLELRALR